MTWGLRFRLRAMLEELHDTVRPEYRPAVEDELDRAAVADREGLGGAGTPVAAFDAVSSRMGEAPDAPGI